MSRSIEIYQPIRGEIHMLQHKGMYGSFDMFVEKEVEFKNLIVTKASELMANIMKPSRTLLGIEYLAVGTGYGTGTTQNPQASTVEMVSLRSELTRKAITSSQIINNTSLELTTTFTDLEAVGALVEMGLFGGNASSTANSGYMFNHRAFPVWNKPNDSSLTIIWTILF